MKRTIQEAKTRLALKSTTSMVAINLEEKVAAVGAIKSYGMYVGRTSEICYEGMLQEYNFVFYKTTNLCRLQCPQGQKLLAGLA